MGVLTWQWGCRGCWHVLGTFGWDAWVQSSVQGEGDAAVQWGPAWLCHVQGGWYWSPNVWCRVMGSVLLGPGRVDLGAGIRAKHWGLCTWSCAAFWSTKLCLLPPPRLMGWECTTVPCVRCVRGSRGGKCCFFHSELLVWAGRGWVCEEGRQGRAHSRALFLAVGLDDVLCCSLGRAHSSGNIWGFT